MEAALTALDLRNVARMIPAVDLVASVDPDWQANMQKRWDTPFADVRLGVSQRWRAHAYPLKQLTVRVQGTRLHDKDALVGQLATVTDRLRAGDTGGHHHDDDFGYSFELTDSAEGPSFFDEACGRR
jgi:hypothetical protein